MYYNYAAIDVQAQAGQLALQTMDPADRVTQFKAWLDATPDADLTAKGLTSTEVADIKSAFGDLAAVVAVFRGTAAATQSDRQTFVRRLLGPTTY